MTVNLAASILARLLNLAKQRGDDYSLLKRAGFRPQSRSSRCRSGSHRCFNWRHGYGAKVV